MGTCLAKRDTPEMMPSDSPSDPRNPTESHEIPEAEGAAPGSPKSPGSPKAPSNLNAPRPPPIGRRRSMQMDQADMSKMLTQFSAASPMSPKRSPVASPGGSALLPPPSRGAMGKRCLVIDLDETLVHTERQPSGFPGGRYDFKISVTIGAATYNMYVAKRPGCDAFLRRAAENYELVIFTASMEPYCKAVMDKIDPGHTVAHSLHRTHCTFWHEEIYVKDLSRLGRDLKNCILLDNNPDCYLFQPENAIPINSWYDDPSDMDLEHVLGILDAIAKSQKSAVATLADIDKNLGWGRVPKD